MIHIAADDPADDHEHHEQSDHAQAAFDQFHLVLQNTGNFN